ncbi:MAG: hypothetical protein DCF25_19475 [Leptolyngbya foveolarum]|uniref:Uncharacterized protein n=1 Tax=Leptolyngbya foveolarum TaxID=47253 RepID=A0A2W4TXC7_9CYAN|nr:MAG: hypothetical protein DCF25_19475 [Leptolyngbya foveolarum]
MSNRLYSSNMLAASLLRYIHWRYVSDRHRLIDKRLSAKLISATSRAFLSTPLMCLLALA